MRSASDQPGRIGSGLSALARRTAASAALVEGRNSAAGIDRVAQSRIQVSSTWSLMPLSRITWMSIGVESMRIHSPGRVAVTAPNGPSGA